MKRSVRAGVSLTIVAMTVLTLGGCKNVAQRAVEELERNNILYSVESFVAAAGHGDLATVQIFLDAGMDPDAQDVNGYTALMLAAEQGHANVVESLLARGARADVQGVEGSTALMQAAFHNRSGVVEALLAAGASGTLSDEKGWTAFMKAVFRGHNRIVKIMLPGSADQLERAIMVAAIMDHRAVAESLLAAGAPVDFKDRGQTPLMMAAARGNEDMVRLLLNSGAEPLQADPDGRTASMIAMIKGHKTVARMLQEAESGTLPAPPPPLQPEPEEAPVVAQSVPTEEPAPGPGSTPLPIPPNADTAGGPVETASTGGSEGEVDQTGEVGGVEGVLIASTTPGAFADATVAPSPIDPDADIQPDVPLAGRPPETVAPSEDVTDSAPGATPEDTSPDGAEMLMAAPAVPPTALPEAAEFIATIPDAPTTSPNDAPAMTLVEFHETRLPIILTAVEGGIGEFRMQDENGELLYAEKGQNIPGTDFRVSSLSKREIIDKRGDVVDAAEAVVRDESSGQEVRLVKGLPARATRSFALLSVSGESDPIKVRENEEFSLPNDPATHYRVLDLRDSQAVIQQVDTGETFTIGR